MKNSLQSELNDKGGCELEETNKLIKDILDSCDNKKYYKERLTKIIDTMCKIEMVNLLKLYKNYLNLGVENKDAIIKCRNRVRKSEVKGFELFNTIENGNN